MSISSSVSGASTSSSTKSKDLGLTRMIAKARSRSSRIKDHKCELMSSSMMDVDKMYPLSLWRRFTTRCHQCILVSGGNKRCKTYLRSSAAVCFEEERQLVSPHWYIIHPFSTFRVVWQVMMCLVLLFQAIYSPFVLTFVMTSTKNEYSLWYLPSPFLCVMLFSDLAITFVTGIIVESTKNVILDPWVISRTYLRGYFTIDLVTAFPWDIVILLEPLEMFKVFHNVLVFDTIMAALNFYRVLQMLRFLKDVFEVAGYSETTYHLVYLVTLYSVYLHWAACAQFLVPYIVLGDELPNYPSSWIVDYDLLGPDDYAYKYECAMIRAFSLAMRLGYGRNVDEQRFEDAFVSAAILIIGFFLNAVTFGVFLHFITEQYTSDLKYQSVMLQLRDYMRHKELPSATQKRMVMYYENKFQKGYFKESAILATLSEGLREAIYLHCCQRMVMEVELFHDLPPDVLIAIIGRLRQELYLPTDVIVKAGVIGDCMYFIQIGTAAVYTPTGKEVCHLQDGDFFGEIAMLHRNSRRVASVIAVDICEVYRLDRADYKECIAIYKELSSQVERVAQLRKEVTNTLEENYKRRMENDIII